MNEGGFTFPVVHNAVSIMTPFLLAGIGGLMTELAGMLNIALEGLILIGAFFSVVGAAATGSLAAGIIIGVMMTVAVSLLFAAVTLYLKANVFITGLATNLFAAGLTTVLSFSLFATKGVLRFSELPRLPVFSVPRLHGIPIVGDLLFGHDVLVYIGWAAVAGAWVLINRTPFGCRLRGTGSNPAALRAAGLRPQRYQMAGILLSGVTCGIAGAILTLNLGAFVPNISSGRGWIALVVIYLGAKRPFGIMAAAFLFGLADSISNYAQGVLAVPADLILAFPYVITVTAMIVVSAVQYKARRPRSH
jgi:general nucleoside transport system permease protein